MASQMPEPLYCPESHVAMGESSEAHMDLVTSDSEAHWLKQPGAQYPEQNKKGANEAPRVGQIWKSLEQM